jgi:hypothetical protein
MEVDQEDDQITVGGTVYKQIVLSVTLKLEKGQNRAIKEVKVHIGL